MQERINSSADVLLRVFGLLQSFLDDKVHPMRQAVSVLGDPSKSTEDRVKARLFLSSSLDGIVQQANLILEPGAAVAPAAGAPVADAPAADAPRGNGAAGN